MLGLHRCGGLNKRHNLPVVNIPVALTQYIENRNTHTRSYHTSALDKGVPYHAGQAIVIPGTT